MDESNYQEDLINNNGVNDNNAIEEEDNDEEYENKYNFTLDKKALIKLKQNDPSITNLTLGLHSSGGREPFFNSIDWKENGGCIVNNTHLKRLRIYHNPSSVFSPKYILGDEGHNLPKRRQLQEFFSCIYRNSSIHQIEIIAIDISDEFGGGLIEGLSGHSSLIRLEIGQYSSLGSRFISALGKILKHPMSKLKVLSLPNIQVDEESFSIICEALLGNTKMKSLCLKGNTQITSTGWRALSTVLQHPDCKLTNLVLGWTDINDVGSNILGSALSVSSIKALDLSNAKISSAGWQTLLNELSQASIEKLHLFHNCVSDASLASLTNISTLKVLDISINKSITPEGWQSFFNTLQPRGTKLQKLDICGNAIGDIGVTALGSLFSNMSTLKALDMGSAALVTSQGWVSFFTTLQESNLDLVDLNLGSNSIDDEGIQLLVRLVSISRMISLTHLYLGANRLVSPTGWEALTSPLQSPSCALEELYLDGNKISDDTLTAFKSALGDNRTLKRLSLERCTMEDEDASDNEDDNEDFITRGWEALSSLLCNKSSIIDTYTSNHTLQYVGPGYAVDLTLPGDLASLLELNRNKDKAEVARQKILQTHFSNSDSSKIQELLNMELEVMPIAIAWIGRPTRDDWNWNWRSVSGLSLMYNTMRRIPDLFDDSNTQKKKPVDAKRKRDS